MQLFYFQDFLLCENDTEGDIWVPLLSKTVPNPLRLHYLTFLTYPYFLETAINYTQIICIIQQLEKNMEKFKIIGQETDKNILNSTCLEN